MNTIRSPIVAVLGHVDHGKTTLLDAIRKSRVAKKEAGGITQMVGASYVSKAMINSISGSIAAKLGIELVVPGLLFIDTPGHEAFTSLRERGGSIADIAILVVDAMQGFQPQTIESINILKQHKTPFVVAMNKIDLIDGWNSRNTMSFLESLSLQPDFVKQKLDERLYTLVGELSRYGFDSERFDRVTDFSKQLTIIPVSAKTKEGIAELLILIAGLSQKYLKDKLYINKDEPAKGTIIEVKTEKGMGTTIDVILYDGVLRKGDIVLVPSKSGIVETKVRGLFQPNVASNNPKEKYIPVNEVVAAAGVKVLANGIEDAIPGSPFGEKGGIDEGELTKYIGSILYESKKEGVLVKADSLGSSEAMLRILDKNNIPVAKVDIGAVSKEDVLFAKAMQMRNKYLGVVFAFNVSYPRDVASFAESENVCVIHNNVIYKIVEDYHKWVEELKHRSKKEMLSKLPYPAKIRVLPGFLFRLSKPAIFGVEVLEGTLMPNVLMMAKDGRLLGEVKSIQEKNEKLERAEKGSKVAISMDRVTLKKDVHEGDILYTAIRKHELELWLENKELLDESALSVIEEIRKIHLNQLLKK